MYLCIYHIFCWYIIKCILIGEPRDGVSWEILISKILAHVVEVVIVVCPIYGYSCWTLLVADWRNIYAYLEESRLQAYLMVTNVHSC